MLYCADVAGAFDRVKLERLVAKLEKKGLHPHLARVLKSWLGNRTANVAVGGALSRDLGLSDMVYQGIVLGPVLWNLFYGDVQEACAAADFLELVYADDLNAYTTAPASSSNEDLLGKAAVCQREVHRWGVADGVTFEGTKESPHVLSPSDPAGENFKMLGVIVDPGLRMQDEVSHLVGECSWKLEALLRTIGFHSPMQLLNLYKAYILSVAEYRTGALYHASDTVLEPLDRIQKRFLRALGWTDLDALVVGNLAPLGLRRDIAMLGMIHRSVLGKGASHFSSLFCLSGEGGALVKKKCCLVDVGTACK